MLQSHVLADLKRHGQEHFIIERTANYFKRHIQNPSAILGVRTPKGELMAQSIFHHSSALNPDYIKGLSLDTHKICDPVSILQGAIIHPEAQGQGLLSRMIEAWLGWAEEKEYKHILTRIEAHNEKSLSVFKKAGLAEIGTVVDARDNANVVVLYKRRDV